MGDKATITAIGAGRMGRGMAIAFAYAGHPVRLIDMKPRSVDEFESLKAGVSDELSKTFGMLAGFGMLRDEEISKLLELVTVHPESECEQSLRDVEFVFEGIPEKLEAKRELFAQISPHLREDAILTSTTSTILSDDLQPSVTGPERFLNAHWLNPAFLVPLVELSPGKQTDAAATDRLKALLESIGKVPVVCAASPGYIVPRIQALAMNEAARMVEEGVATAEDIDSATKFGFGFRFAVLGLLEFIDWGGGDILYYASRYMTQAMNDDRFASPKIVEDNMENGRIGLSTREGFLDYSNLDVPEYQRERLSAFVAMLRHLDKMPVRSGGTETSSSPQQIVRDYLQAMEQRELERAKSYLASGFEMTFPGPVTFSQPEELAAWASDRYQSVAKTYEGFDECAGETETVVYCRGTLQGVWLDGSPFSGIRFIDRFTIAGGLITSQDVWNDMGEELRLK